MFCEPSSSPIMKLKACHSIMSRIYFSRLIEQICKILAKNTSNLPEHSTFLYIWCVCVCLHTTCSDSGPVLWQSSHQPWHSDTRPDHEHSFDSSPVCDSSSRLLHCCWLRRLVQPKWLCGYHLHLQCHIPSQGELQCGATQEKWKSGGNIPL